MKKIKVAAVMNVKPKLLDQVRAKIRLKHYSIRTEQAYVDWIRRYILFHGKRHPQEMGKPDKAILRTAQRFQPLQFSQRLFRTQRVEVEFRQRGDDRMHSLAEQRQLRRGRSGPPRQFPPQHLSLQ